MNLIELNYFDLMLAAVLVLILALLTRALRTGLSGQLLIAAMRTIIQLTLIGLVLKTLFTHVHLIWVSGMALVMLAVAGHEVLARQKRRLSGAWGYAVGSFSMFISSFTVAIFALLVVIQPDPWYTPRYAIPLLGMLLGNTMSGVAIGLDRLTQSTWDQRQAVEARLMLGHSWNEAISSLRTDSVRAGLIPIVNAMSAAGIVSLPGMMTGQILSGTAPVEAVKYQILIMLLIAAGTGFGTLAAIWLGSRRLFDERHRLRLDRLKTP